MKCFTHPASDAVALCKACSRGLCRECVVEVGLACACRNRCEKDVAVLNDLIERSKSVARKNSSVYRNTGIFTVLLGQSFILYGAYSLNRFNRELGYFCIVTGALIVLFGLSYLFAARRWLAK